MPDEDLSQCLMRIDRVVQSTTAMEWLQDETASEALIFHKEAMCRALFMVASSGKQYSDSRYMLKHGLVPESSIDCITRSVQALSTNSMDSLNDNLQSTVIDSNVRSSANCGVFYAKFGLDRKLVGHILNLFFPKEGFPCMNRGA